MHWLTYARIVDTILFECWVILHDFLLFADFHQNIFQEIISAIPAETNSLHPARTRYFTHETLVLTTFRPFVNSKAYAQNDQRL